MAGKNILCLSLIFIACATRAFAQDFTVVVDVPKLGRIQGNAANTARDVSPYWVFHGIPYAEESSYTGSRRFQPSTLKSSPLTEDGSIFLANRLRVFCPQNAILIGEDSIQDIPSVLAGAEKARRGVSKTIREAGKAKEKVRESISKAWGQEDCLTLTVNTPRIPVCGDEPLLPVVLFIHGGGSDSVFGSVFSGLRLMDYDVVYISINYRLGTLGSFNLGIDEAPGCGAMYDAITSLQWIQSYIKYFGGDPNRVTITGQSAGAMMVTHLLLSPLASNLFHGVWGFSGAVLNVWATFDHSTAVQHHLEVAHFAGCYDRDTQQPSDPKVIADCMVKNRTIDDLVTALNFYRSQETSSGRSGFEGKSPASIQNPMISHPKFLVEDPTEILKAGKQSSIPLVLGATRHDGSYPLDDIYNEYLLPSGQLDNATYVQNVLVKELMTMMGVKDVSGGMYHSMTKTYLGDAANSADFDSKIPGLIDISTVFGFKGGEYKMLEYHAKIQPKSYFYSFDYKGRWTLYNLLWGLNKKIPGGICHTDELMYIFYMFPLLNDDMKVSRRFLDYFVNFATYGDPNGIEAYENPKKVIWPAYDPVNHTYLIINRKDKIGEQCPDSWSGASLELMKPEARQPVTPHYPYTISRGLGKKSSRGLSSAVTECPTPPTEPTDITNPEPTTDESNPSEYPKSTTSNPDSSSKSLTASFYVLFSSILTGILALALK